MKTPLLTFKRDAKGKVRWQLKHGNNKILDSSSQGFSTKAGAVRNFKRTRSAMNKVNI